MKGFACSVQVPGALKSGNRDQMAEGHASGETCTALLMLSSLPLL